MSREKLKQVVEYSKKLLIPLSTLSLLAISFLSVRFKKTGHGFYLSEDNEDLDELLDELDEHERKVAEKLLSLGLDISYELIEFVLDEPVKVGHFLSKRGLKRDKYKQKTVPDFRFKIGEIICYIEVGSSNNKNQHKRDQKKVVARAIEISSNINFLYVQLFKKDVKDMVENCDTQEDLFDYLLTHENCITSPEIALCFL